jgi:long-subunit fatty acid transport protein
MVRGRTLGQAIGVVALVSATIGVSTASAQVDYEIMASLQFNFSNPGARSLAMAGALTGAGDDATGAWTNPGGLTNITRPEVGVEFRGFNFETPFVSAGHFPGQPSGRGQDTIAGRVYGISEDSTHSLSFVSAVVPKSRFAFAFYRTELANFETSISTEGTFFDDPDDGTLSRAFPYDGTLELKIANFGGSVAFRLTDQFSVGAGLSYYDFDISSDAVRYGAFGPGTAPGSFVGPPLRTPDNVVSDEIIDRDEDDDSAFGVNVGVSINPSDALRIGASYRQGPKFGMVYRRIDLFGDEFGNTSTFKVPDVFGVGVLVKPLPQLNIAVDYRRVAYSQLTQDMKLGFDDPDDDFIVSIDDYVLDDGNEFRAAGEYLFTNFSAPLSAIAVRGGLWYDPDHRIRYEGPPSTDTVLYPAGDSEMHYTGGAGIVFEKFQFDVGFDRSEAVKTFSVSAVLRF